MVVKFDNHMSHSLCIFFFVINNLSAKTDKKKADITVL